MIDLTKNCQSKPPTRGQNIASSEPSKKQKEQRDGETENQRFGRNRDSHDTDDLDESPLQCARFRTLIEAAQSSLDDKSNGDPVFKFARALKAFELTVDTRLPQRELPSAFNIWWKLAASTLPTDTDREECLFLFLDAYAKAKTPLGSNVIQIALDRIKSSPPPPEVNRYESPKLKTLVHLCYELQLLAGENSFFLSVRDAASAIGLSKKSLMSVSSYMKGLIRDGIIKETEPSIRIERRATRYRYVSKRQFSKD